VKLWRAFLNFQVWLVGWIVDQLVARSFCCGRTGWWSLLKFSIAIAVVAAFVSATGDASTAILLWPLTFLIAGLLPFGGSPHLPRGWTEGRDDGVDEWLLATPWRRKWLASEYLKASRRDSTITHKLDTIS